MGRGHVLHINKSNVARHLNNGPRVTHGGETPDEIGSVAINRPGTLAAARNRSGELLLFDLQQKQNCEFARFNDHRRRVTDLVINESGEAVVSAGDDKT